MMYSNLFKVFASLILIILLKINVLAQTTTANLNFSTQNTISPYIYGFNQDHQTLNSAERWTIRRLGGNRMTTFNWENNASNSGDDNLFTSNNRIPELVGVSNANKDKAGEAYKVFHQDNTAANVASIITVPIQGFVAADKLGAITASPPSSRWHNLIFKKNAAFSLTPSTADANVYLDESINFLKQTFPTNKVQYIALDNEPAYWDNTHSLTQTSPSSVVDYVQKVIDAAKAVKAVDPSVKIVAGEFAGTNIFDFGNAPDWATEKGTHTWFISYFLQKMKQASDAAGYNLIDVLSVHFYPAHRVGTDGNFSSTGVDVRESVLTDAYVRSARMDFTRSLWDETYIEPSWLSNQKLKFGTSTTQSHKLYTRLQESVNTYYPGLKIMIGETDYGHDADISHGIATADFLGVTAAKNIEIVTRWDTEPYNAGAYTSAAYKLFRNYNGSNGAYGNVAIGSTFNSVDKSSVWTSMDSDDGEVHLILLNKDITNSRSFTVNMNRAGYNFAISSVHGFDATNANITSRTHNGVVNNGSLTITLPNLSAYHIVLSATVVPVELVSFDVKAEGNLAQLKWQVESEQNFNFYEVEKSADGKIFTPLSKITPKNTKHYATTDEKPFTPLSYYRLKMVDLDGTTEYSPIKSVAFGKKQTSYKVFPNPTNAILNIDFNSESTQTVDFELVNAIGQTVQSYCFDSPAEENQVVLKIQNLPRGLYALRIKQGNAVTVEKVIIE